MKTKLKMNKNKVIVFYDAYCVLCDSSIIWLIENDKNNILQFSHFKSDFALSKIKNTENSDTVSILTSNGEILQKSDAVIFLLTLLKKYVILKSIIQITPKVIRDFFYDVIAKNRYKWFGKYESCKIPKSEWKSKFL